MTPAPKNLKHKTAPLRTPLLHPAASLCALSAHTLHKAGEVLTFSDQTKQTLAKQYG